LDRDAANLRAAIQTEEAVHDHIVRGAGFVVETVLSSDKYKSHVEHARTQEFNVGLIYVALASAETAIARVRDRVRSGGHDVPAEKIKSRWSRSLDNLAWFATRVQRLLEYSNDDPRGAPILVAYGIDGRIRLLEAGVLPEVTNRLRALGATEPPAR